MLLCLPGVVVSGSTGLLSLCCTQDKGHSTESGKDSAKQHSNSRFFRAPRLLPAHCSRVVVFL